jgi:hypothetical protein
MDFGPMLARVSSDTPEGPLNGFAAEMTRKLCFYANSSECTSSDAEVRRIARVFQEKNYDFLTLVREFFASPLVTGATPTTTFDAGQMTVSIARRDHVCTALSNRLERPDLCALVATAPSQTQSATARIATSVAADAFSRGAESPITPSDPTLFYRAATEMLCENVANQVIDGTTPVFTSANAAAALPAFVEKLMGYAPSDPNHAAALQIVQSHYDSVLAANKRQPAVALKSAFVLACEAPTALSVGL